MRVRVHPADKWGCGYYRLIWAAEYLQSQGHDVHIADDSMGSGIGGRVRDNELVEIYVDEDKQADVYVFQRTTGKHLSQLVKLMRERGFTVVIDMDDDLSCIHPKNAAFNMLHPKRSPMGNWLYAADACRVASLVTVSTPNLLARYAGHGRGYVLQNYVPERYLSIKGPERDQRLWGWAGALHSHPDDVPLLRGPAESLNGHEFQLVGNPLGMGKVLGLRMDPPGPGIVELTDWPQAIVDTMDVGAAPLADSRFNRSKSWLKPLEYSALGIPWVASSSPEYSRLQMELGAGLLARSDRPRDWVAPLKRLLTDDALYEEQSQALREAAARFTIERNAEKWLEAWSLAYHLDHAPSRMYSA